jgi:hypothetical protein
MSRENGFSHESRYECFDAYVEFRAVRRKNRRAGHTCLSTTREMLSGGSMFVRPLLGDFSLSIAVPLGVGRVFVGYHGNAKTNQISKALPVFLGGVRGWWIASRRT